MKCLRCNGNVIKNYDELKCIMCSYDQQPLDYSAPDPNLDKPSPWLNVNAKVFS